MAKKKKSAWGWLSFVFLLAVAVPGLAQMELKPRYIYKTAPGTPFFRFDFEALDGTPWNLKNLAGKPVILLTGHRDVRYDIEKWAMMLKYDFADKGLVHLLWVVNPSRFRWDSDRKHVLEYWSNFGSAVPLILDWHSQVGRALKIVYKTPNIIGIDNAGKLAFHETCPCNPKTYEKIFNQIQALVDRKKP